MENYTHIWTTILTNKEETVKGFLRQSLFILTFLGMASMVSAQLKIGYILSERIRTEYEEFKEAESQLQLEYRKVQF